MAFNETIKLKVKHLSAFRCCRCQSIGVEIHHIIPQADKGPDTIDNAAPLCPSCHDYFGANPVKRKEIKEMREWWYEKVKNEKIAESKTTTNGNNSSSSELDTIIDLSSMKTANIKNLNRGPILHNFLPQTLINRIKIIHLLTKGYISTPLDETIENFRRDAHPEVEVEVWERIIIVLASLSKNHQWQDVKIREALKLSLILSTSSEASIDLSKINLDNSEIEIVKTLWGSDPIVPITVSAN